MIESAWLTMLRANVMLVDNNSLSGMSSKKTDTSGMLSFKFLSWYCTVGGGILRQVYFYIIYCVKNAFPKNGTRSACIVRVWNPSKRMPGL
jgi:hypothetical protein